MKPIVQADWRDYIKLELVEEDLYMSLVYEWECTRGEEQGF